jgi:hypothetical protein
MPETAVGVGSRKATAIDTLLTLAAGAVTGMVTKTAVAPLERTKVLFQLQGKGAIAGPPKYTSVPQALRLILSEEGPRGWYKGNGANCFRIVPVYALKFGFNDSFKGMMQSHDATGRAIPLGLGGLIAAGSLSGMLQCAVTYPLELVYTRLVMATSLGRYKGIVDCFVTTARTEGVGALYKGFGPSFVSVRRSGRRVTPAASCCCKGCCPLPTCAGRTLRRPPNDWVRDVQAPRDVGGGEGGGCPASRRVTHGCRQRSRAHGAGEQSVSQRRCS